jgi:transposase-like protein
MSLDVKKQGSDDRGAAAEGARRATEAAAPAPVQRWSKARKRAIVMRRLAGESMDALSRETGVPQYMLQQWFDQALAGIDAALSPRKSTPELEQLKAAQRKLGEFMMENELLKKKAHFKGQERTS